MPFTAKDLWNLKRIGSLTPSSCGQKIAYDVRWTPEGDNQTQSQICVYDVASQEVLELTTGRHNDSSPVWSPDGQRIVFLSDRMGGKKQLFSISIHGGEAAALTNVDYRIADHQFATIDGKDFIVFVGLIGPEVTDTFTSAQVSENRMFRYWDRWLTDEKFPHLLKMELDSGEITNLTEKHPRYFTMMDPAGSYTIHESRLVYSANVTPPPYDSLRHGLFEVDLKTNEVTPLLDDQRYSYTHPRFSPDGRLFFNKGPFPSDSSDHQEVVEITEKGERVINPGFDRQIRHWDVSNEALYFATESDQRSPIYFIDVDSGQVHKHRTEFSFSLVRLLGDRQVVCLSCSARHPHRIEISERKSGEVVQIHDPNAESLKQFQFGEVECLEFEGARGEKVGMTLIFPPNFDRGKKWPLLQMIHGGPHSCFGDIWHPRWNSQVFAQHGYVVACVNYHGSTGFGESFAKSIKGHAATLPHEDIMLATDHLIESGYIDENRMAASGGSYGGYMTSWIAGHTDRFKALINHSGVFDAQAQYASDVTFGRDAMFGGSPWEGLDKLDAQNPARFAKNFKTPMLVIHGQLDYRVPVTQGIQAYTIYKSMGLDSRLVYFPDENHWILKRGNSEYWYQEFLDWLDRHVPKAE